MTTLVTADDKGRLCIRGTKQGQKYLVKHEGDGWWVTPIPELHPPRPASRNRREWAGSKRSLAEHLQALADAGLRIDRAENATQPVPPCRF
jgi:hypothetical protein